MDRRDFIETCGLMSVGGLTLAVADALAQGTVKSYGKVRLTNPLGAPLKARSLKANTNYIFHYPFAATPCFLLDLGRAITTSTKLKTQRGTEYGWSGGVGANRSIVAYSAICAHKLAYPAREVSFIRFQANASKNSEANAIHCCADHSVYDPAGGARVKTGPAPEPLAAVVLQYDAASDEIDAVGIVGAEQFEPFFQKYEFKLAMEYGGRAKDQVAQKSPVLELTQFCRNVASC